MADFTSGLMAIAVELQDKIFQQVLLQPDGMLRLRALSRTCSGYRSLLAPYTHRAVHLMNNVENSISVDALASGVYRDNVQELHYRGLIPRSDIEASVYDWRASPPPVYVRSDDADAVFPPITGRVLSNLHLFPNLKTVTVEFPFTWLACRAYLREDENDPDPESSQEILAAEEPEGWRYLIAKSFGALVCNNAALPVTMENLEIRNLAPWAVSVFGTDDFRNFLRKMKRVNISLREGEHGRPKFMAIYPMFRLFVNALDTFLFDHLVSTTDFTLKADVSWALGAHNIVGDVVKLTLTPYHMQHLRRLELGWIFLCRELVTFLVTHLGTLEKVIMRDCVCHAKDPTTSDIIYPTWARFFDALIEGNPRKLRRLEISTTKDVDADFEYHSTDPVYADDWMHEYLRRTRTIRAAHPEKRLWPYLDWRVIPLETADHFFKGDDQRAFDALMAIVDVNAAGST